MRFDPRATRPKDIDWILSGLRVGIGRNRDRFRVSSETYERKVYAARVAMVKDLANRLLFDPLRARLDGRVTTTQLYQAWSGGEEALQALVESNSGKFLAPLLDQFLKESTARGKEKYRRQIERFIETIGGRNVATTDRFTTEAVADFLADLKNLKTKRTTTAASASTQNRYRAALQGFASWLVRRHHLNTHPIAHKAVPKRSEAGSRLPEFSSGDYAAYFKTPETIATEDEWFHMADREKQVSA